MNKQFEDLIESQIQAGTGSDSEFDSLLDLAIIVIGMLILVGGGFLVVSLMQMGSL